MSTDPIDRLLDRNRSRVAAKELIELACPLLREIVNEGTRVHVLCEQFRSDEKDIDLAAFVLYRHILELTDGIEVLLRNSCVIPAVPSLRSSFEASLELDYLMEGSDFRRRSLSWLYCAIWDRIRRLEGQDPRTERGRGFDDVWEEEFGEEWPVDFEDEEIDFGEVDRLRGLLKEGRFTAIRGEHESHAHRHPDWFQLFDGPNDRRVLARRVGRRTEYDVFYRNWSAVAHGGGLRTYLDSYEKDGEVHPATPAMRTARRLHTAAANAATFLLRGIARMLHHYRPEEDLERWYRREVKDPYRKLSHIKVQEQPLVQDPSW